MALTKAQQARYVHIIHRLAKLSRQGWSDATAPDWEPLQKELDALTQKKFDGAPLQR